MNDGDNPDPTLDSPTAQTILETAVPASGDADATLSDPAIEATARRDLASIGPCRLVKKIGAEGHYPEASNLLLETYNTRRRVLGRDHQGSAESAYSLAELYALEGRRDEAIAMLGESIDDGLTPSTKQELSTDPELKSLHGDPRFDTLVADAQKGAASPVGAQ